LSSDFEKEFLGSFVSIIAAAAVVGALIVGVVLAPIFGLAAVPAMAYIAWRNSPQFKEQKARERTLELYGEARKLAPPDTDAVFARFVEELGSMDVAEVAYTIFVLEGYEPPDEPPAVCNSVEGARYRDQLLAYMSNAAKLGKVDDFVAELMRCLPKYDEGSGLFQATATLANDEIEALILPFYDDERFFHKLRRQIDRNYAEQKRVMPSAYKGDNCAFAYLKDTPLLKLENRIVPIDLTHRTSHMWVVGGSGHGKTSLIQYMVAKDLGEDCTVVVIDNQRQMIPKLANLDLPLDEVTYISPRHNLGINLFDVGYRKLKNNEEQINATVELLEYVLSGLMGAELTPKQQLIFQYAIQLAIAIPGANIHTFLDVLKPKGWCDYAAVVDGLAPVVRDFFNHEFDNETQFGATKKEIAWRIWGMLKNPTFARIFAAKHNPIDMYEELEDSRLILIDTDLNRLGEASSAFFGRLFVALLLRAARRRFEKRSRRVYVYIDEAPIYFDRNLASMLEQARKANIGLILAHQDLEQARAKGLLSSLTGNTAIKFAGGLSDTDARAMAGNMRCDYQFIKDQEPLNFAAWIQGQGTFSIRVPVGAVEGMAKRENLKELVAEMEENYGYRAEEEPEVPDPPTQSGAGDEMAPGDRL